MSTLRTPLIAKLLQQATVSFVQRSHPFAIVYSYRTLKENFVFVSITQFQACRLAWPLKEVLIKNEQGTIQRWRMRNGVLADSDNPILVKSI